MICDISFNLLTNWNGKSSPSGQFKKYFMCETLDSHRMAESRL